jgi:hypothetical protein
MRTAAVQGFAGNCVPKTGYPTEFCSFNGGHTPDPSDGGGTSWEYQTAWNFLNQF